MTAAEYNLPTIEQGADWAFSGTVKIDNVARDLSGFTARMQLRRSNDYSVVGADLTTANSRIALNANATTGLFILTLDAATTATITPGKYDYDLELVAGSSVEKLMRGCVLVRKEVTLL